MHTWHIHIEGQVQGVGFRPFVFLLAKKNKLNGWVNNSIDGVHIEFNASEILAKAFKSQILRQAPPLACITQIRLKKVENKTFTNFQIVHSSHQGEANLLLSPDFALCADCRQEIHQLTNRRRNYPFITCTNCGPRYSIIYQLPYDRETSTMDTFSMCENCQEEYENPENRRYYSQTNSCSTCGIELSLFNSPLEKMEASQEGIMKAVIQAWQKGQIVAIKGIGGYLLTCDASNAEAVLKLRQRKFRPSKPLALMFPNVDSVTSVLHIAQEEIETLYSPISPIVIAEIKKTAASTLALAEIAPHLNQLGAMIPYTPLYEILLHQFASPIVATSGNISKAPIIFEDQKALQELFSIADYVLVNNRKIVVSQDDSIIKYSSFKRQKIILRRSRGIAPTHIQAALQLPKQNILAMGAMLKSTFTLLHQKNIFISQYLGDLESFDTQENYNYTLNHFLKTFKTNPEVILCDAHPDYPSTYYGQQLAQKLQIPQQSIQHHLAHFSAILGEHHLVNASEAVLGVIWDGTGLGDDGQIWGGEFFKYEAYNFQRVNHFEYFDFILGDKMPKEPRISALALCRQIPEARTILESKFQAQEWKIYSKLLEKEAPLKTSSVGRIFDAVASLLGLLDQQTYEGEAAMRLEGLAQSYFHTHGLDFPEHYLVDFPSSQALPTRPFIQAFLADIQKQKPSDWIAAKFHYSLVMFIKHIATQLEVKQVAFSGGVFQNSVLIDLIHHHLSNHFDLYFHQKLSPNDENISFGQLIYYHIQNQKKLFQKNNLEAYVFSNSR